MRLVNDDRELILEKVVEATFSARQATLKADEETLAVRVRNSQMTPAQIKALDSLPRNYFGTMKSYDNLDAKWGDDEGSSDLVRVHPHSDLRVPLCIRQGILLIEDKLLWDDLKTWQEQVKELNEERTAFYKQTQGVLAAFTTLEKLVEHWPTLKNVMGPGFFEARAPKPTTLPTTQINGLDEVLREHRPFPAEQALAA